MLHESIVFAIRSEPTELVVQWKQLIGEQVTCEGELMTV